MSTFLLITITELSLVKLKRGTHVFAYNTRSSYMGFNYCTHSWYGVSGPFYFNSLRDWSSIMKSSTMFFIIGVIIGNILIGPWLTKTWVPLFNDTDSDLVMLIRRKVSHGFKRCQKRLSIYKWTSVFLWICVSWNRHLFFYKNVNSCS